MNSWSWELRTLEFADLRSLSESVEKRLFKLSFTWEWQKLHNKIFSISSKLISAAFRYLLSNGIHIKIHVQTICQRYLFFGYLSILQCWGQPPSDDVTRCHPHPCTPLRRHWVNPSVNKWSVDLAPSHSLDKTNWAYIPTVTVEIHKYKSKALTPYSALYHHHSFIRILIIKRQQALHVRHLKTYLNSIVIQNCGWLAYTLSVFYANVALPPHAHIPPLPFLKDNNFVSKNSSDCVF